LQTEQDIAQIAGAGLNWVRVPIPFWAIDVWAGEPFYARGCWKWVSDATTALSPNVDFSFVDISFFSSNGRVNMVSASLWTCTPFLDLRMVRGEPPALFGSPI